jgi:hypothetical protein
MRFMILIKATPLSESGAMPDTKLVEAMHAFNKELIEAGIRLSADGLQPSSKGARVRFNGSNRTVTDGPFAETKELIAGFWVWQCKSLDEAIAWVKRCPNPFPGESEYEIEIRQLYELEDLGPEFTPELRESEKHLREQIASRKPN